MSRRIARVRGVATLGVLIVLALCAGPLHADTAAPSPDSWSRLARNVGCALSIAATAVTGGYALGAALVMCVRILFID